MVLQKMLFGHGNTKSQLHVLEWLLSYARQASCMAAILKYRFLARMVLHHGREGVTYSGFSDLYNSRVKSPKPQLNQLIIKL